LSTVRVEQDNRRAASARFINFGAEVTSGVCAGTIGDRRIAINRVRCSGVTVESDFNPARIISIVAFVIILVWEKQL
jgi:hypothetical protein